MCDRKRNPNWKSDINWVSDGFYQLMVPSKLFPFTCCTTGTSCRWNTCFITAQCDAEGHMVKTSSPQPSESWGLIINVWPATSLHYQHNAAARWSVRESHSELIDISRADSTSHLPGRPLRSVRKSKHSSENVSLTRCPLERCVMSRRASVTGMFDVFCRFVSQAPHLQSRGLMTYSLFDVHKAVYI